MLDHFSAEYDSPIIVVANVNDKNDISLPEKFYEPDGFSIDSKTRLTFCRVSNPECTRKIILNIINMQLINFP
jgi:hypothetical protein